jgi:hypothetical protein
MEELVKIAEIAVNSGDLSSSDFARCFPGETMGVQNEQAEISVFSVNALMDYLSIALTAVVPLALALIISITVFARDRIHNPDIVLLGILFAALGMFALNLGMNGGITAISSQTGRSLRHSYREAVQSGKVVMVKGIESNSFVIVPGEDGPETYIWIPGQKGPSLEKFAPSRLSGSTYIHIPVEKARFSNFGILAAYLSILAVVFFLGFFAIFAEPGLAVTAVTVEDMTTGTFKRQKLILLAAIGVGSGMIAGFARVLFSNLLPSGGIHLSWILVPCYGLALLLTIFAPEDFASIAWDVAGIATGPIAVPIMITTGLGLGSDSLRADGAFGIVATASVFPILIILISGIIDKAKSKRALRNS